MLTMADEQLLATPGSEHDEDYLVTDNENAQVPPVHFIVTHGKIPYELEMSPLSTVLELKQEIEQRTQIPPTMQKLVYKGMLKDDMTIDSSKIKEGVKVILIGSKVEDVLKMATSQTTTKEETPEVPEKIPLSELTKPLFLFLSDRWDIQLPLPPGKSIKGMLNSLGQRTRLTFKDDLEQVWIGTAERTQKIAYDSIKAVQSEPIQGDETYYILSLQLGPTEKSRYFIYWVPAQYVETIKDTIMGGFVYF
ncbi:ubiquitin-related domain-containing protein [Jimgerdemannia flammicorona]|uniref:Ubiquitin-related domain-containing protein n=1 Tax=Jimgerdemannia flammicorona TaxID=994334 RepID=A0A433QSC8_9FUNG|nr:ubiquitin-related domain-containing protein [Jimgerdemannia flammicorona]